LTIRDVSPLIESLVILNIKDRIGAAGQAQIRATRVDMLLVDAKEKIADRIDEILWTCSQLAAGVLEERKWTVLIYHKRNIPFGARAVQRIGKSSFQRFLIEQELVLFRYGSEKGQHSQPAGLVFAQPLSRSS
jgi:hypothetical protein